MILVPKDGTDNEEFISIDTKTPWAKNKKNANKKYQNQKYKQNQKNRPNQNKNIYAISQKKFNVSQTKQSDST